MKFYFLNSDGFYGLSFSFFALVFFVNLVLFQEKADLDSKMGIYIEPAKKILIDKALNNEEGCYFSENKVFYSMGTKALDLNESEKKYREFQKQKLLEIEQQKLLTELKEVEPK